MQCQRCGGQQFTKEGHDRQGRQVYRCKECPRRSTVRSASAFAGYRFSADVIALAVCWYLWPRHSYPYLAELLPERGVHVDPSAIYDWVQQYTLCYQDAARPARHAPGDKWSIDGTSSNVGGIPQ